MNNGSYSSSGAAAGLAIDTRREMARFNARMRHFHGVAASVIGEAEELLSEIWEACQDPRTPEEIIDGVELGEDSLPECGWPELKEKLYLLGHYLDYAHRLLQGSVSEAGPEDKEVEG